jgi:hypothetical protein
MRKLARLLTTSILSIGISYTAIESAVANPQYDAFKKTQYREFEADNGKCSSKKKRLEQTTYTLCSRNSKPVSIIMFPEGAESGVSFSYRNGKLVQVYDAEHFTGLGFRNNRLIVKWNDLEQTVNADIKSFDRQEEKRILAESRKALGLFGLKP